MHCAHRYIRLISNGMCDVCVFFLVIFAHQRLRYCGNCIWIGITQNTRVVWKTRAFCLLLCLFSFKFHTISLFDRTRISHWWMEKYWNVTQIECIPTAYRKKKNQKYWSKTIDGCCMAKSWFIKKINIMHIIFIDSQVVVVMHAEHPNIHNMLIKSILLIHAWNKHTEHTENVCMCVQC